MIIEDKSQSYANMMSLFAGKEERCDIVVSEE